MKIAKLVYFYTLCQLHVLYNVECCNIYIYIYIYIKVREFRNGDISDMLLFVSGVPEFTYRALGKPRLIFMWTVPVLQYSYFWVGELNIQEKRKNCGLLSNLLNI